MNHMMPLLLVLSNASGLLLAGPSVGRMWVISGGLAQVWLKSRGCGTHGRGGRCASSVHFELAGRMGRSDADTVKSAGINAHELGGALPVAGAIPGLAKGIASIELASRAEKAAAAKTEALEPGAYGKAGVCRKHSCQVRPDADTRGCQKKASA